MKSEENTAPLGQGIDKAEDSLEGSLEEVLQNAKGVSGISAMDKSLGIGGNIKDNWVENPQVDGQFQDDTSWRKTGTKVLLFDLSQEDGLEEYSKLVNDAFLDDPKVIILDEDKQFCKTTENWKILLQVVEIEYRQMV